MKGKEQEGGGGGQETEQRGFALRTTSGDSP